MLHNTLLAIDNDAENGNRGYTMSGTKTGDPYTGTGYIYRNNIPTTSDDSPGIHFSGTGPITGLRKQLYGPNFHVIPGSGGDMNALDGSINSGASTLASLELTDLATTPYDFEPISTSNAHDLAVVSDILWDFDGNLVPTDGSAAAGARQTPGAAPPVDPPVSPPATTIIPSDPPTVSVVSIKNTSNSKIQIVVRELRTTSVTDIPPEAALLTFQPWETKVIESHRIDNNQLDNYSKLRLIKRRFYRVRY